MSTILAIVVVAIVLFLLFKVFKLVLRLLLVVVFLGIAYLTNPDLEDHQQAVKEKAESNNTSLSGKTVAVSDYLIFSFTRIIEGDDDKLVGVGLFTVVWIFRTP
jgi:membrane protein required for beta-lactamase induction